MHLEQGREGPETRPFWVAGLGKMLLVNLTDLKKTPASQIGPTKPNVHILPDPEEQDHYIFIEVLRDPKQLGRFIIERVRCNATIPPASGHPRELIRSVDEVWEVPDPNYTKPNPVLGLLRRIQGWRREVLETWEATTVSVSDEADPKFEDYSTGTLSPRFWGV